jgi:hypothetical protein
MVRLTCPMYTLLHSQDTVYSWSLKVRVIFYWSQQVVVFYPEDGGSRFRKKCVPIYWRGHVCAYAFFICKVPQMDFDEI